MKGALAFFIFIFIVFGSLSHFIVRVFLYTVVFECGRGLASCLLCDGSPSFALGGGVVVGPAPRRLVGASPRALCVMFRRWCSLAFLAYMAAVSGNF